MGLDQVPSTASLARIFREAGVARLQPRKRPRAAWRRFVYPAPNACWHLDATEYVLTGGGKCVIFQLIDDHSRYPVASHVASGETAEDAIAVFDKAVAAHGVPQRLLSDNGLALNPSRRGVVGQLVAHGAALGTEAITGKPDKPTTGGQERTLPPDPVPLPRQAAARRHARGAAGPGRRVRPHRQHPASHQGLPGRSTPLAAWEATSTADPPRPKPDRPVYQPPVPTLPPRPKPPADLPADTRVPTVSTAGTIHVDKVFYKVDVDHAFQQVHVISDGNQAGDKIVITNLEAEILTEHTRPAPGIRYVGNGRRPGTRPRNPAVSPKS